MREMSPKQFFDEVGGATYDSVRKHFKRLEEYGWLRKVRSARPSGRGRPQDFYRATELAVIDDETWGQIPLSIRDAFTLQLMQQLSERVGWSLAAGTMDVRGDRVLSLRQLEVDEQGWKEVLRILSRCFGSLEHEQTDAKVRIEKQGRAPVLMIVALAAFESPRSGKAQRSRIFPSSAKALDTRIPWTIRLAKVFGDPTSLLIVRELNAASMSATELQARIGGASKPTFDRKCKNLADLGWIAQVDEKTGGPRRGGREIFYRATSPAATPDEAWAAIPRANRIGQGWEIYRRLCELAFGAVSHGTFNRRVDRHLTWCTVLLDEDGWQRVITMLNDSERLITDVARRSKRRISANNRTLGATIFLGGFESPPLEAPPAWGDQGQAHNPAVP